MDSINALLMLSSKNKYVNAVQPHEICYITFVHYMTQNVRTLDGRRERIYIIIVLDIQERFRFFSELCFLTISN